MNTVSTKPPRGKNLVPVVSRVESLLFQPVDPTPQEDRILRRLLALILVPWPLDRRTSGGAL